MRPLRRLFIFFLAAVASCLTAMAATNTTLTVTLTAQVNAGVVTTGLVNFCNATAALNAAYRRNPFVPAHDGDRSAR